MAVPQEMEKSPRPFIREAGSAACLDRDEAFGEFMTYCGTRSSQALFVAAPIDRFLAGASKAQGLWTGGRLLAQARRIHLRSSLDHNTPLAIAMHTPHCWSDSGAVPKAWLRNSRWTTAT